MATVTKSIGTSSRDYSTATLWEADLDNGAVYSASDDAVGEGYNDSEFDETVIINGGSTIGLSSIEFTVASGERHDGTAGTGTRLVATSTFRVSVQVAINTTIAWWEIDYGGLSVNGGSSGPAAAMTVGYVRNTISHNVVIPVSNNIRIWITQSATDAHVLNNIAYDMTGGTGVGNEFLRALVPGEIHNNTFWDGPDVGIDADSASNTISNNVCLDNANNDFELHGSSTKSHNASSDATATGTGSLTSVVAADQFVSTTAGSEDLHLIATADCVAAGTDLVTTPTNVEIDIDGQDRDASGRSWDIGADLMNSIGSTIGTSSRDYSTMTLWEADLDDTVIYVAGDDAIGECYNDSAFDESLVVNGGSTVGLSSITLKAATGEGHDGTAGSGVRDTRNSGTYVTSNNTTVPCVFEDIEWDGNDTTRTVLGFSGNTPAVMTCRRCILHSLENAAGDSYAIQMSGTGDHAAYNNFVFDINSTNTAAAEAYGIRSAQGTGPTVLIYNNSILRVENDNGSGDSFGIAAPSIDETVENNIICDTGGSTSGTIEDIDASTTEDYSVTSDATGTGTNSIASVTTADQFVSTTDGSVDLHLAGTSDAIGEGRDIGTTPDEIEFDIDGFDRDTAAVTWDIGAEQYQAPAGSVGRLVNGGLVNSGLVNRGLI